MSIRKKGDQIWKVRWREAGRHRSVLVNGPHELAKKIERKKMSARDENRHLEVRKEVYFPMKKLIERYEEEYARKKKSYDRERSVLNGIRKELGSQFVGEVDGAAIQRWYGRLVESRVFRPVQPCGTST